VQDLVNHELCRGHTETSKILFTNSQTRNIDNNHNHFFWERILEVKKNVHTLSKCSSEWKCNIFFEIRDIFTTLFEIISSFQGLKMYSK